MEGGQHSPMRRDDSDAEAMPQRSSWWRSGGGGGGYRALEVPRSDRSPLRRRCGGVPALAAVAGVAFICAVALFTARSDRDGASSHVSLRSSDRFARFQEKDDEGAGSSTWKPPVIPPPLPPPPPPAPLSVPTVPPVVAPTLPSATLVPAKEAETREDARKQLVVETNLRDLVPRNFGSRDFGQTDPKEFSHEIFELVVEKSGLRHELTDQERGAFKTRFMQDAEEKAKKHPNGISSPQDRQQFLAGAAEALEHNKPVVTKALVDSLNAADLGFESEHQDWMVHESMRDFNARLGRSPMTEDEEDDLHKAADRMKESRGIIGPNQLPEAFDSREAWPHCADIIGRVHDQGHCGSCWVHSALGALDGRLCIRTGGNFSGELADLSRGFASSCVRGDGCRGGWEYYVFKYVDSHLGIPTAACSPYFASGAGVEHFQQNGEAPPCPTECSATYSRSLDMDYFKPTGVGNYMYIKHPMQNDGIIQAKAAMYSGGPIPFGIYASSKLFSYRGGVFGLGCGSLANHAVLAIGWGKDYLLGENSWGTEWGDNGFFKVDWCAATDFTIPGDIDDSMYPLPIPRATRTTSTTTPEPAPPQESLACRTDSEGCITSPGFPGNYWNNQECVISPMFGQIRVVKFDTERNFDTLSVNGVAYSGRDGPAGVVPETNIVWKSDYSNPGRGWRICPPGASPANGDEDDRGAELMNEEAKRADELVLDSVEA